MRPWKDAKIIVPTPALSEVLIRADDAAPKYLEIITRSSRFKVVPFGDRAAVEAADAHRRALDAGDKKEGTANWAKVKYDRQIMAMAKVESADCVYSNDGDLVKMGVKDGIPVVPLAQPPEPPAPTSADQLNMFDCSAAPRMLDLDVTPIDPPTEVSDRTRKLDLDEGSS